MTWSGQFKDAAHYNERINQQLLTVCENLSCDSMLQDRGVFFDSIIGTWNHLLVTDLLWLQRLNVTMENDGLLTRQPKVMSPNQVIAAQINEVSEIRLAIDKIFIRWIEGLDDQQLSADYQYQSLDNDTITTPLASILQHIFNHQVHHRGQLTALLSQAGVSYGHIDFLQQSQDVIAGASG